MKTNKTQFINKVQQKIHKLVKEENVNSVNKNLTNQTKPPKLTCSLVINGSKYHDIIYYCKFAQNDKLQ